MSKLARKIRALQVEKGSSGDAVQMDSVDIQWQFLNLGVDDFVIYKIGLNIGVEMTLNRSQAHDLPSAVRIARKRLVNEVFGEFLFPVNRLRKALADYDFEQAQQIADEIYNQMFVEGI